MSSIFVYNILYSCAKLSSSLLSDSFSPLGTYNLSIADCTSCYLLILSSST
jgi:hypothetical protein